MQRSTIVEKLSSLTLFGLRLDVSETSYSASKGRLKNNSYGNEKQGYNTKEVEFAERLIMQR